MTATYEDIGLVVVRPDDGTFDESGPCSEADIAHDTMTISLRPGGQYEETPSPVCLEAGKKYEVRIVIGAYQTAYPDMRARVYLDSVCISLESFYNNHSCTSSFSYRQRRNCQCSRTRAISWSTSTGIATCANSADTLRSR